MLERTVFSLFANTSGLSKKTYWKSISILKNRTGQETENSWRTLLHILQLGDLISSCASPRKLVSHKALLWLLCKCYFSNRIAYIFLQFPKWSDFIQEKGIYREWKCTKNKSLRWSDTYSTVLTLQFTYLHETNTLSLSLDFISKC